MKEDAAVPDLPDARWSNWSGSVTSKATVLRPRDEAELSKVIVDTKHVRAAGAGHSFMPLCACDDVIVSLQEMAGTLVVAPDRRTVRAPAGWSLKRLTAALWAEGLALANQGDVNPQSLAGSTATGTHGTGRGFGSLSTFVRGMRLIDSQGRMRWCDAAENEGMFQAARLSLGVMGIATEIEIAVVPAFHLHERIEKRRWAEVRESFDDLVTRHRHVEFWIFPYSDSVILKTLDTCDPCEAPQSTKDMGETVFGYMLNIGASVPALVPLTQRLMMKAPLNGQRRGPAYAVFPSDRTLRFEEMEYEMPVNAGLETLDEVIRWIRAKRLPVSFPFEYRVVAADNIWLSPMNAGPVASISMHQYARMPWQTIFSDAEAIFRAHGGRPHWAKRHTLTRADVDALYPMAESFRKQRREVDPDGVFLNPHLGSLFS